MKHFDFVVTGNGVAAMVAAMELARGGSSVALWNPAPQWGAHFGGIEIAGRNFDVGMNLLEFTSFAAQSEQVASYSAHTRNDAARFTSVIRDYIGGLVEYVPSDVPQCLLDGIFAPDMVIANRLDLLTVLPPEIRTRITAELAECVRALEAAPAWHARNKLKRSEDFATVDFETVSVANHGPTLHGLLIEPSCRRILGMAAREISALLHRVAWTPLYYPETLLEQLNGVSPRLPPTDFFYPREGNFAAIVSALEQRIRASIGLEVWREKSAPLVRRNGHWRLGEQIEADRLVWALRPGQLTAMLGGADDFAAYAKASVHVAFATVDSQAWARRFSTLFILDADSPCYRITDQTWAAGRHAQPQADCTIEISSAAAADWRLDNIPALTREIAGQLVRRGVLRVADGFILHAVRHFKDAIVAPTAANRSRALAGHAKLAAEQPDVELIGAAAPFGASSFNDHVMQGLRVGHLHRRL